MTTPSRLMPPTPETQSPLKKKPFTFFYNLVDDSCSRSSPPSRSSNMSSSVRAVSKARRLLTPRLETFQSDLKTARESGRTNCSAQSSRAKKKRTEES